LSVARLALAHRATPGDIDEVASIGEKITRTIAKAAFVTGEQSGVVAVARCAQGLACAMLAVADRRHRVPRASTSRPTP
jgi:hypothetical protein